MKLPRRTSLIVLLLGFSLLLGVLFRSFILDNFVRPVALVFWLIWRILLSVNQQIYWGLLIASALVYTFFRLAQGLVDIKPTPPSDSNLTLYNVDYWRTSIQLTADKNEKVNILKQNLGEMLTAMYTSRQSEAPHWEVYEALRQRQIPLPDHIYAFLFPAKPLGGRRSFQQVLQTIWQALRKWARRWKGRDVAEYYQSIEEVLTFMESSMEIKHDDKHFDTYNH